MKIKTVNDYVKAVHEQFPELSESEVKRILVYGWRMIMLYVRSGNDVSITTPKLFFYVGRLFKNSLHTFNNYCEKLSRKIEFMFKRTHVEWDGYYYFSRSENQYIEYLQQSKKKYKVFKNVKLYKILEELKVKESSAPYIFRLKEDKSSHYHSFYPEIKTKNAELIIVRDALKMEDILTTQNKFKYIQ